MANRAGPSFSVTLMIKDRMFDAASVCDLDMAIPMNGLPRGNVSVMITGVPDYKVDSGCYGRFVFLNTGYPEVDGKGFSFYVLTANQTLVNEDTTKITFTWRCATDESMVKKTMAITGTSLDAMIDILKSYKNQIPYKNLVMSNASGLTDTMTWRYANANLEDMLIYTVNHSALNGDYLFWTYDEVSQKIVFSSLGISKKVSKPQALVYSQNALNSTNNVRYTDPNTGSQLWLYSYEERSSQDGKQLEEMFPNVVFSSVTSDGKADIGTCGGKCFDNVVTSYGAMSSKDARETFSVKDPNAVYGEMTVVDNFPLNTHKSYQIAGMIRQRIYAEYSKLLVVGIQNSIGPAVGSSVAVRSLKVTKNGGNGGTDMNYTDEYIVLAKKIKKEGTTQAGALGNSVADQSAEYVTVLILGSNSVGINGYKPAMEKLANIADACKVDTENKK